MDSVVKGSFTNDVGLIISQSEKWTSNFTAFGLILLDGFTFCFDQGIIKCGSTGAALAGNGRPNWGNDADREKKKEKKRKRGKKKRQEKENVEKKEAKIKKRNRKREGKKEKRI